MIGLIALAILGGWFFVALKASRYICTKVKNEKIKRILSPLLVVLIFIAPVMDEVIGAFQFKTLCSTETKLIVDENATGKTVVYENVPNKIIHGYAIPITESTESYKDVESKNIVIKWNVFRARGGWLSRNLRVLQYDKPYIFDGVCLSPKWNPSIFSDLKITETTNHLR